MKKLFFLSVFGLLIINNSNGHYWTVANNSTIPITAYFDFEGLHTSPTKTIQPNSYFSTSTTTEKVAGLHHITLSSPSLSSSVTLDSSVLEDMATFGGTCGPSDDYGYIFAAVQCDDTLGLISITGDPSQPMGGQGASKCGTSCSTIPSQVAAKLKNQQSFANRKKVSSKK